MRSTGGDEIATAIPKKRQRRYSWDESVDEPAKLIELESVDVEAEAPAEENEPVQSIEPEEKPDTPAFEDDESSR
jgi:hypothetical protein